MGGPGSGSKKDPNSAKAMGREARRAKARVIKRLRINGVAYDLHSRNPYEEIVPGLKREDVLEFLQLVRAIRNDWTHRLPRKRSGQ